MYRPGDLDQLITFKRWSVTDDGYGGSDKTLTDVAVDIWARIMPMSGRESKRFEKLNPEQTNSFVVRYRDDILEDDSILWDGDLYNIRSIQKAGSRELYLVMYAERGVAT